MTEQNEITEKVTKESLISALKYTLKERERTIKFLIAAHMDCEKELLDLQRLHAQLLRK